jgi:hypothetical protein
MRLDLRRLRAKRMRWTAFGLAAMAIVAVATVVLKASQDRQPDQERSLLQTLAKWQYPGSTMLDGASMSDGGNPTLQSVKCKALLTTADPIDKVIAYYSEKLETPAKKDDDVAIKGSDAKSVTIQNDSQDRPVTVRVIVVNKTDTSTTLVISRANGEKETHIAWLHYIRLDGKE